MISPVLIIGFKLSNVTIAISALIMGAILQTIYRKMKKKEIFTPFKLFRDQNVSHNRWTCFFEYIESS